jgi:tetratricopeptide (TPR) repeat protein
VAKILILILLAFVAYADSLYAPFVFDDLTAIQHNRSVRFFSFDLKEMLRTRSLLYPTFAFNQWLGGENVFGYHVVNLLLHIINGLLVFAIARRIYAGLRPSPYPLPEGEGTASLYATLAAAFFIVHPVQTEAVTYISERSELSSKLVFLCGLLFFMILPEEKIGFFTAIPVLFFTALGVGFKETAVTLPAIIFLYDYIFLAKGKLRNLLSRWPFYLALLICTTAGAYVFWDILKRPLVEVGEPGTMPKWNYFLTSLRVTVRFLRLIVLPTGQNLDYDFPAILSAKDPALLASVLLISALLIMASRWRTRRPVFAFSIFWFFIVLIPTSGVVAIPDVIFEHRLYVGLAGVALSFPLVLEPLGLLLRARVVRVATVILAALLVATIARNYVWADSVRLFSDEVEKSPHKIRAYINLTFEYMKRGQETDAVSVVNAGLKNAPAYRVSLLDTMGNLYLRMGKPAAAIQYFTPSGEEAVQHGLQSSFIASSFNNLGAAYIALAKTYDALHLDARRQALLRAREAFQKSLERQGDVGVLNSLVNVSQQLGEAGTLEDDLRKKLASNPKDFNNLYMLATLLSLQNRYLQSIEFFRRAEEQSTTSEMLHFNYGFALSKAGQTDRAIDEYVQALRIDPIFNEAHYNLALLYLQKADYNSAVDQLNDVVSIETANVPANLKLAEIYAYERKLSLARQYLQQVLKQAPQDREALSLLAKIGE